MPLPFKSTNHGTIAFGFFNIDSDMLLMENRFFFATDFCEWMNALCLACEDSPTSTWSVWEIAKREDVGDLMGAINGHRHMGFIGETYKKYPFPKAPEDFKQRPEGDERQGEFREMLEKYAVRKDIDFISKEETGKVKIGGIGFDVKDFWELIRYVWRGGYPRWRDEVRPEYVMKMKQQIEKSNHWLFRGIDWEV